MHKKDLALNNIQWLICYKPNQTSCNPLKRIDLALHPAQGGIG